MYICIRIYIFTYTYVAIDRAFNSIAGGGLRCTRTHPTTAVFTSICTYVSARGTYFFFRKLWSQNGRTLPSSVAPSSIRNHAKGDPNAKPNRIIFSMPSFIDFGSFLVRICKALRFELKAKLTTKSIIWLLVGKFAKVARTAKTNQLFYNLWIRISVF